jgi:drug/metabolite transporter (DMT)-like permease
MNPLPLILIIISTFMHAAWNISAKSRKEKRLFFRRMLGFVAAAGFLPAVASELYTESMPPAAWLYCAGSGAFCGSYFYFLARSYESSDFTVAYPVARALPVLLIAVGDALRGMPPTILASAGLLMVAAGCLLAPLESFKEIKLRRYFNKGSFFILLTAAGTVGYSLLDKIAQEAVSPGHASAFRYGYFFYLFTFLAYILYPVKHKTRENSTRVNLRTPYLCGAVAFISYSLILWAYQLTEQASYVVAFRQFSIVIGVLAGLHIFREKGMAVRLAGSLLLTAGLVLIAIKG